MQNDPSTSILKINDFTGDAIFQNRREIQELEEWRLSSWKCREMTRSSKNWRLPSNSFFHKKKSCDFHFSVSYFKYEKRSASLRRLRCLWRFSNPEKINVNFGFRPMKGNQDNFGFWIPGTVFQNLSLKFGFWISIVRGIPDSLSCIPDSKAQDSRFHDPNFLGFWNPDSLTWGDWI